MHQPGKLALIEWLNHISYGLRDPGVVPRAVDLIEQTECMLALESVIQPGMFRDGLNWSEDLIECYARRLESAIRQVDRDYNPEEFTPEVVEWFVDTFKRAAHGERPYEPTTTEAAIIRWMYDVFPSMTLGVSIEPFVEMVYAGEYAASVDALIDNMRDIGWPDADIDSYVLRLQGVLRLVSDDPRAEHLTEGKIATLVEKFKQASGYQSAR